jgi:hypothetical protein
MKTESSLTFIQLLRHFAACTSQKQSHLTYLLTLLKLHEPIIDFSLLPSTGKELMEIDGLDFPTSTNEPAQRKMPVASLISEGKYFHFGLENALKGTSVGLIHRDADLLHFVDVYLQEPGLLPKTLRDRVSSDLVIVIISRPNEFPIRILVSLESYTYLSSVKITISQCSEDH